MHRWSLWVATNWWIRQTHMHPYRPIFITITSFQWFWFWPKSVGMICEPLQSYCEIHGDGCNQFPVILQKQGNTGRQKQCLAGYCQGKVTHQCAPSVYLQRDKLNYSYVKWFNEPCTDMEELFGFKEKQQFILMWKTGMVIPSKFLFLRIPRKPISIHFVVQLTS